MDARYTAPRLGRHKGTVNRSIMERTLILLHLLRPTELQTAYPWSVFRALTCTVSPSFKVCSIRVWGAVFIFWTPQA